MDTESLPQPSLNDLASELIQLRTDVINLGAKTTAGNRRLRRIAEVLTLAHDLMLDHTIDSAREG